MNTTDINDGSYMLMERRVAVVSSFDRVSALRKREGRDGPIIGAVLMCAECKFDIYDADVFCGGCGKLIKWVKNYNAVDNNCGMCGDTYNKKARYCTSCGNPKKT